MKYIFKILLSLLVVSCSTENTEVNIYTSKAPETITNLIWRYEGSTKTYIATSEPAHDNKSVYFTNFEGQVISLDLEDGKVNWKFQSNSKPTDTSPILSNKKIYFPSSNGNLYCINSQTGQEEWAFLADNINNDGYVFSCLSGSDIIFTQGNTIYSVYNEKENWNYKVQKGVISTTPLAYDEKIIFANSIGIIYCLDSQTGELLWKIKTEEEDNYLSGSFIPYEGKIFYEDGFYLKGLDVKTGQKVWQYKHEDLIQKFSVSNGIIFFTSYDGFLTAMNINNNSILWKFEFGAINYFTPVITDNIVFTGGNQHLFAVDLNTGQEKWKFKSEDHIQSKPILTNNKVVFISQNGVVYAIE